MNSLISPKYAGRVLTALAAITGLFLTAGCGSGSGITPPNTEGFSNSSLNGTYVFSAQGADVDGAPVAIAGTLVAGGSGKITGGTIDIVDPEFDVSPNVPPSPAAQTITGGSYTVGTDGRGKATITSPYTALYGAVTLDFVLTSTSHGLVTEFDESGTGSGTIDLQTAVTSLSQLAGPYAFSITGTDSGGGALASAGAFTLSGSTVAGVADYNDAFNVVTQTLTGTATLGTGTGPNSITLTTASFPLTFDFYPIDSTHWKLIETDYSEFLAGDVFTQTGATSIPTGTMAFTMSGSSTAGGPVVAGGFLTNNGTSFSGTEDLNNSGTVIANAGFTGVPGTVASIGGRVVVSLSGFDPGVTQWVVYPSSGGLLMLETDTANVMLGAAYAQTATSFGAGAYGLNLSGVNGATNVGEVDDVAQFNATTTNLTGVLDEDDSGTLVQDTPLTATYTPDSPADGRGVINATDADTYLGGATLQYYVVNNSTVIFIEVDSGQVSAGTFELQSTPSSSAAVAQSRMSFVRAVARSHKAIKTRAK
jgi:hypothetical protein